MCASCGSIPQETESLESTQGEPGSLLEQLSKAEAQQDVEEIARLHLELLAMDPSDLKMSATTALALEHVGRELEAVSLLQGVAARERNAGFGVTLGRQELAALYLRLERKADAAGLFEELGFGTQDATQRQAWLVTAASLWESSGNSDRALLCYEALLEKGQGSSAELQGLARARAFQRGEPETIGDAVTLLRTSEDPQVRNSAIQFLSQLEFPHALQVFLEALDDEDARVVHCALEEITKRGGLDEAYWVLPWLYHPDEMVVRVACDCLGLHGDWELIGELLPLLESDSRNVFRASRKA
ncbi:MAG: hypothetical protein MK213_09760, partial [Planctomycetes bacterium]|nr:hypothetical protein [Planctomycetota bacterium]